MTKDWQLAITPTDTVWGLVAKLSPENIERIYQIKGRDKSKPLIIFAQTTKQLQAISTGWDPYIESVVRQYWPGSLTLVMPRAATLAAWINPNTETIAMRIPKSDAVNELLEQTENGLLLSTSANLSGEQPVNNYQEAVEVFANQVDLIIDSNEPCSNQASTIIGYQKGTVNILRQGAVMPPCKPL